MAVTRLEVPARAPAGAPELSPGLGVGVLEVALGGGGRTGGRSSSSAPGCLCRTPRCCCQLESCSSCSPVIDLIISIPSVLSIKVFVSSPCCRFFPSFRQSDKPWKSPIVVRQFKTFWPEHVIQWEPPLLSLIGTTHPPHLHPHFLLRIDRSRHPHIKFFLPFLSLNLLPLIHSIFAHNEADSFHNYGCTALLQSISAEGDPKRRSLTLRSQHLCYRSRKDSNEQSSFRSYRIFERAMKRPIFSPKPVLNHC